MDKWLGKRIHLLSAKVSDTPNATTIRAGVDTPVPLMYVDISGPLSDLPLTSCTPASIGKQSESRLKELNDMLNSKTWVQRVEDHCNVPIEGFRFSRDVLLKDAINKVSFNSALGLKEIGMKVDIPIGQLLNALSKKTDYMDRYRAEYLKHRKNFRINHNLYPIIDDSEQVHTSNVVEHYKKLINDGWDNEAGAKSCIAIFTSKENISHGHNKFRKGIGQHMCGDGRLSVYKWLPNANTAEKIYKVDAIHSIPGQAMLSLWYQVEEVPVEIAYWIAAKNNRINSSITSTIMLSEFKHIGQSFSIDTQCVTSDSGWLALEQKRLMKETINRTKMSQKDGNSYFPSMSIGKWSQAIGIRGKRMNNYGVNKELISVGNGANNSGTYLLASVPHMQMLITHFNAEHQHVTPTSTHARFDDTGPRYTFNTHGTAREISGLGDVNIDRISRYAHNDVYVLTIGMWNRTAQFKTGAIVHDSSHTNGKRRVSTILCPNRDLMLFR